MSIAVSLRDISSFVEDLYSEQIALCTRDVSRLEVNGGFRRFVVARMGSTRSTWLAKLLNSHPDVFCSHEGILGQIYPSQSYRREDVGTFLSHMAWDTKHHAYAAVGDIGSAWAWHLPALPFTTALLVRHPARMLQTRLHTYAQDQSFTKVEPATATALQQLWGIDLEAQAPLDQIFLQDLWIFIVQRWAVDKGSFVVRVEDLRDPDRCSETLRALTGLTYDERVIGQAIVTPLNERSGQGHRTIPDILRSFTKRQRMWYVRLLSQAMAAFGYDLLTDATEIATSDCA